LSRTYETQTLSSLLVVQQLSKALAGREQGGYGCSPKV